MTIPLSGLPPLPAGLFNLINAPIIISQQVNAIFPTSVQQSKWGIFDLDGNDVLSADTVVTFDYRNEWTIATAPQEQGAFQSYSKVANPFDVRIRFAFASSEAERAQFVSNAQAAAASLDLYDVITPEVTYINCNITHIDYHRETRNGAAMIILDVWLNEIRQSTTDTSTFTEADTQSINSPDPISSGQIQAIEPSDEDIAALA